MEDVPKIAPDLLIDIAHDLGVAVGYICSVTSSEAEMLAWRIHLTRGAEVFFVRAKLPILASTPTMFVKAIWKYSGESRSVETYTYLCC